MGKKNLSVGQEESILGKEEYFLGTESIFGQAEALSDSINTGKVKASEPVDTETNTEASNSKTPW